MIISYNIMKIFCKRTLIQDNIVYFIKNKIYESQETNEFEQDFGVYKKIKSEKKEFVPLAKKTFDKYFSTIEDNRDNKITQILRNDNN